MDEPASIISMTEQDRQISEIIAEQCSRPISRCKRQIPRLPRQVRLKLRADLLLIVSRKPADPFQKQSVIERKQFQAYDASVV